MNKWISVDDMYKPEPGKEYLVRVDSVIHDKPRYFVAEYDCYGFNRSKVTHWREIDRMEGD